MDLAYLHVQTQLSSTGRQDSSGITKRKFSLQGKVLQVHTCSHLEQTNIKAPPKLDVEILALRGMRGLLLKYKYKHDDKTEKFNQGRNYITDPVYKHKQFAA